MVGLYFIVSTRFNYLDGWSRNEKSKPNSDDLDYCFWYLEWDWLSGSLLPLVVIWLKLSVNDHTSSVLFWNHEVLPLPRVVYWPLDSSIEFGNLVCLVNFYQSTLVYMCFIICQSTTWVYDTFCSKLVWLLLWPCFQCIY